MGRAFCETLMDFSDENPTKVIRMRRRLKKIRRRERRARKKLAALKKLESEQSDDGTVNTTRVKVDTAVVVKVDTDHTYSPVAKQPVAASV